MIPVDSDGRAWRAASARGRSRRARILEAALPLFRERGFHGATIDDIGAAAGITGPALYYHFRDKQALLAAAFAHLGDQMFDRMDQIVGKHLEPEDTLRQLIECHVEVVHAHRASFPVLFAEDTQLRPDDADWVRRRRQNFVGYWVRPLVRIRPELTASVARVLATGAVWSVHSMAYFETGADDDELKSVLVAAAYTAMVETDVGEHARPIRPVVVAPAEGP